jgi:alpha-L-arabinofuranosidase
VFDLRGGVGYRNAMTTRIRIDTDTVIATITPHMTGACMEDVNHEVYGGIFSQMIFGESFEEEPMLIDARLDAVFEGLSGTVSCLAEREHLVAESPIRSWQPFRRGSAVGVFNVSSKHVRRGRHTQQITFVDGEGTVGIENRGLNRWGLNVVAGKNYEGTVVVRADKREDAGDVELVAALQRGDGDATYAETVIVVPADGEWHVVDFELTPDAADTQSRLAMMLRAPGSVAFDYVALHPGEWGRFKGLPVRKDIADALVDQGLTVLRYGGGMINTRDLEARSVGPVYRWKHMIGPRADRAPYWGSFYRYASNGFGIIDFLAFCQAAGFLAVPTLSSLEDPQDVADFIEYVNGDASTEWGARRIADGHPEPFDVKYLCVGNEEWGQHYVDEFGPLVDAIAKADPEMTSIISMWMNRDSRGGEDTIPQLHGLIEHAKGRKTLWDIHVGGDNFADGHTAEILVTEARAFIDAYDPDNAIRFCVLEENGGRHDLQRALGHARIVNTLQRLGDEVLIDCPANCLQPWQQHDNNWDQGQVFFTPDNVWGQPPFYSQQMIARNYLPLCVQADFDNDALDVTATRSNDSSVVVVKVVNLTPDPVATELTFATDLAATRLTVTTLTGPLDAENTPDNLENVIPSVDVIDPAETQRTFPGHSFTVMRFERT